MDGRACDSRDMLSALHAGHGLALFAQPELAPLLFTWLQEHLGMLKG